MIKISLLLAIVLSSSVIISPGYFIAFAETAILDINGDRIALNNHNGTNVIFAYYYMYETECSYTSAVCLKDIL